MKRTWSLVLAVVLVACGVGDEDARSESTQPVSSDLAVRSPPPTELSSGATAPRSPAPATATTPTVSELFALAERTLRSGGMYHHTESVVAWIGDDRREQLVEAWVDATRDAVRVERTPPIGDPDGDTEVELTVDGIHYTTWGYRLDPLTCAGAAHATSVVLVGFWGCGDVMSVERATHEGRPALVLVSTSESESSDGTSKSTTRMIVDPATGLPWAMSSKGEYHTGAVMPLSAESVHVGEFVDARTLPSDLFDPVALGWATTAEGELPTDVPVHWLGRRFDPGHGLPALAFALVEPGSEFAGHAGILRYSTAETASAQPLVMIELYPRLRFDQSRSAPCAHVPPFEVAVGVATFQCPPGGDGTDVLVETPDTVLWIRAVSNAYRDTDAMTLVVRALQSRIP